MIASYSSEFDEDSMIVYTILDEIRSELKKKGLDLQQRCLWAGRPVYLNSPIRFTSTTLYVDMDYDETMPSAYDRRCRITYDCERAAIEISATPQRLIPTFLMSEYHNHLISGNRLLFSVTDEYFIDKAVDVVVEIYKTHNVRMKKLLPRHITSIIVNVFSIIAAFMLAMSLIYQS